jgi:hypothetical protein
METPNHNEAGMLAFALASATLDALVSKGVLSTRDEFSILVAARDSFKNTHTRNATTCAAWFAKAVLAHPLSKQV